MSSKTLLRYRRRRPTRPLFPHGAGGDFSPDGSPRALRVDSRRRSPPPTPKPTSSASRLPSIAGKSNKPSDFSPRARRMIPRWLAYAAPKPWAPDESRPPYEQFQIAYAANPDDHEALFGLWAALELNGDETEAQPIREAARNLDRLNALLQRGRASRGPAGSRFDPRVRNVTAKPCTATSEARAWFHLAIAANPTDHQSQQALFRLESARSIKKPSK